MSSTCLSKSKFKQVNNFRGEPHTQAQAVPQTGKQDLVPIPKARQTAPHPPCPPPFVAIMASAPQTPLFELCKISL